MYLSFYNLLAKPFAIQPDPSFFWLGQKQAEAVSMLRRAIHENEGLFLLTGDAGLGKTTLIHAMSRGLAKNVIWTAISDPNLERLEFYNAIARGFGIDREVASKVHFLLQFNAFLQKAHDNGRRVVLLVDDCHRLSQEMLEELRLLANIEKAGTRLMNIVLAGRGDFLKTLSQPNNRALSQWLALKVELVPLSPEETDAYIRHRLQLAGTTEEIFSEKAVEVVHRATRGNQRLINMICDEAMVVAAAAGNRLIELRTVEDCLVRLDFPHPGREEGAQAGEERDKSPAGAGRELFLQAFRSVGPWRWVMSGLGIALIGGAAGLFLVQPKDVREGPPESAPVVQQPVAREEGSEVSAPPVGKLEPIGKAIEFDIAGDRKQSVVRKEGVGVKQEAGGVNQEEPILGPEKPEDVLPSAPVPESAVEVQPDEGKVVADASQTPPELIAEPVQAQGIGTSPLGAAETELTAAESSLKPPAPEEQTAPVEEPDLPPPPPAKIVLPLLPNSLELTEEAEKDYRAFIERLKNHPEAKLLVKGFVSAKTNSPENIKLSEERAMGVQKLLVKSGIDPARITVKGMGNRSPIASNDTSEGRTKNRRVEIEVVQ